MAGLALVRVQVWVYLIYVLSTYSMGLWVWSSLTSRGGFKSTLGISRVSGSVEEQQVQVSKYSGCPQ